jgi:ribosomal-protein-serine acetyltransferase
MAREMFRLVDTDRVRLGRFLPWVAGMHSVHDEEEYVRFSHVEWDEHRLFDFGIFHDGVYLGNVGAHHLKWDHERCEIGYWIGGTFEGKGFMAEAVDVLAAELFRLGFHRLEIRCDPDNARSAAVPRRCGFVHEATLREHAIENGKRRDTMIWARFAGATGSSPRDSRTPS